MYGLVGSVYGYGLEGVYRIGSNYIYIFVSVDRLA